MSVMLESRNKHNQRLKFMERKKLKILLIGFLLVRRYKVWSFKERRSIEVV